MKERALAAKEPLSQEEVFAEIDQLPMGNIFSETFKAFVDLDTVYLRRDESPVEINTYLYGNGSTLFLRLSERWDTKRLILAYPEGQMSITTFPKEPSRQPEGPSFILHTSDMRRPGIEIALQLLQRFRSQLISHVPHTPEA